MFEADGKWAGKQQGLANRVLQFADIARPGLVLQKRQSLRLHRRRLQTQFPSVTMDKVLGQLRNVFRALA